MHAYDFYENTIKATLQILSLTSLALGLTIYAQYIYNDS